MTPQHLDRNPAGGTTLQWVVLDDSQTSSAVTTAAPALAVIGLSDLVLTPPAALAGPDESERKDAEAQPSLGDLYGRYVGQIHARIDRIWRRPRTAIGAPTFQCQAQIDQDGAGRVSDVALLQCNGDARWQLSLVRAIEAASPLPVPPDPALFARHVLLEFRAMGYSPGAEAGLYELPDDAAAYGMAKDAAVQSQSAFDALSDAARAPHSRSAIELRIEGSKVQVEPEH